MNLTAQQKTELLSAYRLTFESQTHREDVKAMYAKFVERYAVHPDVLRAAIVQDLKVNRKLYDGLRRKLFARQRAKTISVRRRLPATPRNREAQSSERTEIPPALQGKRTKRTVTCPVCAQAVPSGKSGGPDDHDYDGRPCSGEVATCKVCKKTLPVRASDGRMTSHSVGGKNCAGSGRSPYEGRSLKFMQGVTRVVSGGLSSTNRRH